MRKLIGQTAGGFLLRVILVSILFPVMLWAWSPRPPEPEPPTDFPIYGGVAGQFHCHAALTPELNEDLKWQIIRWTVSSWVIDSIGWQEFRDSLLHRLTPPDVRILLQLRWNHPDLNPKYVWIQHCVPQDWNKWYAFCYQMAYLFKDNNVWFQIGNEPDHRGGKYWNGTIPEFIRYVNWGAAAIKEANPDAYVVCGGFIGGETIKPVIHQTVAGLEANVDALDRHFYFHNVTEAEINEYMRVWPEYCRERGFDCFITEVAPPRFDIAKKTGVDCAMMFALWGSPVKIYAAANKDGTATELGKRVGRWIEKNTK